MSNPMEFEMAPTEQGIVIFDGSGSPLYLLDTMSVGDLRELLPSPVAARVLATRLHAWANIVDVIAYEIPLSGSVEETQP